jgi:glutaminyl-peptide cyclotransferase
MKKRIESHRKRCCSLLLTIIFLHASLLFSQASFAQEGDSYSVFGYEIVNTYPHDSTAFTQGLVYDRVGVLYEGTGLYGRSSIRRVDLDTGRLLQQTDISSSLFGEGIAQWEDRIVQLTWQSGLGLVYAKENLTEIGSFRYQTEGWGITSDNQSLIMSDGSNVLHILDPESFIEKGRINVTVAGRPLIGLNELEYIKGEIYANVWPTSRIAIISPESGTVTGMIDLTGILSENETAGQNVDVQNGIAYDGAGDRIFVTGKLWPELFEIRLVSEDN